MISRTSSILATHVSSGKRFLGHAVSTIVNPYAVSTEAPLQKGYFGDHSSRIDGSFLYRVVQIRHPVSADFVYSGWWFLQRITIGQIRVWSKISWLTINREVEFRLPKSVDPEERLGKVEIDFGRGLSFRRFRIWVADELVYDEVV